MSSAAIEILKNEIDSFKIKWEEARAVMTSYETEIVSRETALHALSPDFKPTFLIGPHHNPRTPVKTKESFRAAIVRVLKEADRFVHIKEMLPLLQKDGKFPDAKHDDISKALTMLKSKDNPNQITKTREGHVKNTFWGFESYLDEKGSIKPEHMYKKELVDNKLERNGHKQQSPTISEASKLFGE